MKFTKGHKGYKSWLGKHLSVETRKKLSDAHKGQVSGNKGTKRTEESKQKMSESHKRNPTKYWLGKKLSEEHRDKLSKSHEGQIPVNLATFVKRGKDNPHWKGGITPINLAIRASMEYKLWRRAVFARDKWTCIWCGQVRGNIEADHIKPFAFYPELRFAIDNGRTLCHNCHMSTSTYGRFTK
jgi:hypothetical protein